MSLLSRRAAVLLAVAGASCGNAWAGTAAPCLAAKQFGPRKRILVSTFETVTAFDNAFGGPEAGAAMAAQLATLLAESGQFDVVERSDLDSIIREQGLSAAAGSVANGAQHAAELLGAQVIVQGFVSTFSPNAKSSGFSVGFGNPNFNSNNGTVGTNTSKGQIGIELKLIDTTNAKVIAATHLADTFQAKSTTLSVTGTVSAGQTNANSPVLGAVTRGILAKAVEFISDKLSGLGWAGHVVDVSGDSVFVNVGEANGAKVDDLFVISRVTRRVVDDQSGELLGVIETRVGYVKITDVRDKFSIATKVGATDAQKDDIARYVSIQ